MSWWLAVLAALGVIGFWPLLIVVGDPIDRWFQNRMELQLRRAGQGPRTIGGE